MGATYTRQSSYTDGDTITAAHTNDEFNQILAAFAASTGHTHDGTAAEGGPITKLVSNSLTFGAGTAGTDITITFDGETTDGVLKWMEDEDYFEFSDDILIATTEKIQFRDTAIYIYSSADGQLDLVADTEIQIAATTVDINGNVDVSGTLTSGGNLSAGSNDFTATGTVSLGATSFNDNNITNVGSIQLDSIAGDADTNTSITFSGSDVITIATGGTSALTIDASQNVTIAGDLTISGDDITMATNTAGNLLIADGTNFNSVAAGSLSEISTVANDDVFLAVDTSGGGLKKITRSTIVAGLAVGGVALSNIVEDTTPQLGGNLDMNGADIVTTSNATIDLAPNGTGTVVVRGNTNSGAIVFNCESNSHGQKVIAQPHSAGVTNTLTLPAGGDQTLVGTAGATFTGDVTVPDGDLILGSTAVTSTAAELNLLDGVSGLVQADLTKLAAVDATATELNYTDTGAAVGVVVASKVVTADANKDVASFRNITLTGELDAGSLDISGDADIDGTLEADAMTLNGTAITTVATLSTGISNGNLAVFTSGAADNDFLRIDGTSIEGRSASEVLSDIGATTATDAANEATALAIALG